jgi:hypothetical protein
MLAASADFAENWVGVEGVLQACRMSPNHCDDLLGHTWTCDLLSDDPYPAEDVDEMQELLGELLEAISG